MSKFLKVMIVLLTIAAAATPAIAEDRLSLGGQMYVRSVYSDKGGDSTSTVLRQRLRLNGKFAVAEGVVVGFRGDITEGNWGSDDLLGRQPVHFDRAYMTLSNDKYSFTAGQQYFGFGNATVDANETGLAFTVKGNVPVTAVFSLLENNDTGVSAATSTVDLDEFLADGVTPNPDYMLNQPVAAVPAHNGSDAYLTGVKIGHKTDAYNASLFIANQKNTVAGEDAMLIGVTYAATMGGFALNAELDFFTGDADATTDAVGTQLILDGKMGVSDTLSVGGAFYYAAAADAGEKVYSYFGNDFGGYDPLNYGPLMNDGMFYSRPADVFTTPAGNVAGTIAAQVYADLKASDALALTASLAYAVAEDDAISDDNAMFINLGAGYDLMANTWLGAQLQYIDYDLAADAQTNAEVYLSVSF
jgi:hypothetical protein